MTPRPLGKTGLLVSPIGLGTVKFGRTAGLKYPAPFELPGDEAVLALLRVCKELGINLIDTAPAYGTSEARMGELLPRVAPRNHWVICTKAGEEFDAAKGSTYDFSPGAVRASVRRSLERLRTDTLDIVLLHSDGRDEWIIQRSGGLEALRELKREGKVRAVGISTKTPAGATLAVQHCDVVMLTLNDAHQGDLPAIEAARAAGVGILVKKALASGHAGDPPGSLARAVATPGVGSAIVGTTNIQHLRAGAAAAQGALPPTHKD